MFSSKIDFASKIYSNLKLEFLGFNFYNWF